MCYGCVMMDDPCGLWSQELPVFPPAIPPQERKPIRVLGLFDGIATGELWGGLMEGREGGGGRKGGGKCVWVGGREDRSFVYIPFPFQACSS